MTRWQLQDTSRRDGNSVAQMIHDTVTWRVESGLFGVNGLLAGPLPPQLYEGVPFFSSSSSPLSFLRGGGVGYKLWFMVSRIKLKNLIFFCTYSNLLYF